MGEGGFCVAFSGGVDSAVVLAAAVAACGPDKVHAVTFYSPLHSPSEPEEAKSQALALGAVHGVVALETIPEPILDNPPDRCYLCKKELFGKLWEYARERGIGCLLDGTNADDLTVYRPGLRALVELEVTSPLAALGLGKEQVRGLARELGLPVAEKPANPCLATRFPYGTRLTKLGLYRADEIESYLKQRGMEVVRARIHRDTVRLEVPPENFPELLALREELLTLCRELGFFYVTMDLAGFSSGSMDIPLQQAT